MQNLTLDELFNTVNRFLPDFSDKDLKKIIGEILSGEIGNSAMKKSVENYISQYEKLTFGDLKINDFFTVFPHAGDNSGHGGYKGGSNVFIKLLNVPVEGPVNHLAEYLRHTNAAPYPEMNRMTSFADSMPVMKLSKLDGFEMEDRLKKIKEKMKS